MALVFMDGLEAAGLEAFAANSGASVVSTSGLDMDGDYCLELTGSTDFVSINLTAAAEYYFARRYRQTAFTAATAVFTFYKDTVALASLRVNTDGSLTAYVNVTDVGSTSSIVSLNTTYNIEVYYKVADSGGRFVVKVEGITVIDFTGDTKPGTDTTMDAVKLGYSTASTAGYQYADDIFVDSSSWISKLYIQKILVTAAGTTTQMTPSAGANNECVDEIPASATEWVETNTVGHIDTYSAGNLTGSIGTIKALKVQAICAYEGAPTPTHLRIAVRSSGTDYFSADKTPASSFGAASNIWEQDPATSAAWLEAGINNVEIGQKATA